MTLYRTGLLTPPEEEEVYPYRRVWRSLLVEGSILLAVTGLLFVLGAFIGLRFPQVLARPISFGLAVLPAILWLAISWFPERFVPEPRQRLLAVAVISALAANAIGLPLVNDVLQVDRWLPLSSALNRILGYTFTVGIVQETLKYLVLRFVVWPDHLRIRMDGLAYAFASAIGYTTVLNLEYVLSTNAPPDMVAVRVFGSIALNFAGSAVVGYGLSEVRFSRPTPLLLMITLAFAATINGALIPLRAGLVNAGLALETVTSSPEFGLALSAVVLIAVPSAIGFLVENADRQDREAAAAREV